MFVDFLSSGVRSSGLWQAILLGKSALDVPRLDMTTLAQAESFLECYGFVWDDSRARLELDGLREEALRFLDHVLLVDEEGLDVPTRLRDEKDVRRLMVWTTVPPREQPELALWACSLLRVMHTMTHCESYFNVKYGEEIRSQILERFRPHVVEEESGGLLLGRSPLSVPLQRFEIKASKSRQSVLMKLLHKSENVAADVFDRIGVRFVTRERFDALLVVHYLISNHVIMFANTKPSRSRNTLLDLDHLERDFDELDAEIRAGRVARYEALDHMRERVRERAFRGVEKPTENAFSSIAYRSLQFTCRQMIRIHTEGGARSGRGGVGEKRAPFSRAIFESMDRDHTIRFFFPFEIQIMDQESYRESREGLASHDEYKKRQRDAVKARVLGALLKR